MTSVFCVRANGGEYADHFKNGNYVAIGWIPDTDLSNITEEEQIRPLYRAEYGDEQSVYQIIMFLLEMRAGDTVVTPIDRNFLYKGTVAHKDCSYFYSTTDDGCSYPHRRHVEWDDVPIHRSDLFPLQPPTVSRATLRGSSQHVNLNRIESEIAASTQHGINKLADELLLDVSFLKEIEILLDEKHQIIFQGPPGTGKTYVARALSECLSGSKDRVTLVQFHPSYSYEDFVQGFRPKTVSDEQAGFELRDGPLLRAAERAREDPDTKHFLVIDEINRGNLAKVFGELYFLLEYRDSKMNLQYSDTPFSLPDNLYIIGTMNTADSSIARVDLALRRRFFFVEFHPDEEPVKSLLRRWLDMKAPGMTWVADVVDRANEKLNDRHVAIGPSYFMRKDKEGNPSLNAADVNRIWKHNVFPYIEEHLYGERNRLSDFDLKKLREEASRSTEQEDSGDGDSGVNDA